MRANLYFYLLILCGLLIPTLPQHVGASDLNEKQLSKSVIFYQSRNNQQRDIFAFDRHSKEILQITRNRSHDAYPQWSEMEQSLIFSSERRGWWKIWILNAKSGAVSLVADEQSWSAYPKWSPLGGQYLFVGGSSNSDIYMKSSSGGNAEALLNSSVSETLPEWSPTGQEFVFVKDTPNGPELVLYSIQNKNESPLGIYGNRPSFSPNGSSIVYLDSERGVDRLAIYSLVTKTLVYPNIGRGEAGWPSWSPDGDEIVFSQKIGGRWILRVLNINSNQVDNLSAPGEMPIQANWSRVSNDAWIQLKAIGAR